MRTPRTIRSALRRPVCLLGLLALSCGGEPPAAPPEPLAAGAERPASAPGPRIPDPDPSVRRLSEVEVLTESVQIPLLRLAEKLRVRDFEGARDWLHADFLGDDLFGSSSASPAGRLGTSTVELHAGGLRPVGREAWLESLERRIGPWRRVQQAELKVKGAEFQADETISWGKVRMQLRLLGDTDQGGRELVLAYLDLCVVRDRGSWQIAQLELDHGSASVSRRELFVDVSGSTGIEYEGIRYGQPGNDSDAWNGAAAGDVDGDGRYDIFVPSSTRNFLYRNRGDGSFSEEAEARGLAAPAGGTGVAFFDVDNDGDQDLLVAHVGWVEVDRSIGGATLQLHRNDGEGHFANVTEEVGLARLGNSYSVAVLDYDMDGFLDFFVCGYGRMERELNDSWLEASNGSPNALFKNLEGRGFADVTSEAGLDDHRWSYAVAAADADADGDMDLYVANNFGSNRLYRNDGHGHFADVAAASGLTERGNSMGALWGDLDGDGRLDLFVASHASSVGNRILERIRGSAHEKTLTALHSMTSGNSLFLGKQGGFAPLPASGAENAGWVWGAVCSDFDLDGALDLYCANGFVTGDVPEDT